MNSLFEKIPAPENKNVLPVYNCGQGAYLSVIKNSSLHEYEQYCKKLENDGYRNSASLTINGCVHNSYVGNGLFLQVYYTPADSCMRIAADPFTKELPESISSGKSGQCPVRLWQLEVDHSLIDCGMCYIMQSSDYSFFVIDSAHFYSVNDDRRIYEFMRARTPKSQKVTVAGWFISHGHCDHTTKFLDILRYNSDIDIKGVYYNLVPSSHESAAYWCEADIRILEDVDKELEKHPGIPVYKLHTGQRFNINELEFTVLCTHEDVYPKSLENFNDSSVVLMLRVGENKVCFPGDAGGAESGILEERYGDYLACDIMQAAHHGHFGCSSEFYRLSSPDVALFATTKIKYDEELTHYEANRVLADEAKHVFIASDGTVEFTFPLENSVITVYPDETFEDFSGIYSLWGYDYTDEFKRELKNRFKSFSEKRTLKY